VNGGRTVRRLRRRSRRELGEAPAGR